MKKLIIITIWLVTFSAAYAQKSIDELFEKYAGKDGFTTVTINGNLLKLARFLDNDSDSDSPLNLDLKEIRILTQEDKSLNVGNFYDMVIKDIDLKAYEEFMRVKETDQDVRMLVRIDGKHFKEFLLISGGSDNAIIQIKGDFSVDEAKKIAEDVRKNKNVDILADHK
jgi:hypothetical protein